MIYILIPFYNEEQNIKNLYEEILNFIVKKYHNVYFVFVDDCSTDNTVSLLKNYFSKLNYIVLTKDTNKGPGDSFNKGFEWVLANASEDDLIVTLEADCTSDMGILDTMINLSNTGFNLVLASVYAQSGGFENTTFFRKILSFGANFLLRFILNIKVLTLSSFYRVYSVKLIQRVASQNDKIISEKGFLSMIEILYKCIEADAHVIEVPMTLKSNKRIGKSKMKIFKTFLSYVKFIFISIVKKQ